MAGPGVTAMGILAYSYRETDAVRHAIVLSGLCVVSYWLITHILAHAFSVSRDDDLLGGMWAVVATIFVYRYGYEQTTSAALSRVSATVLSFALCFLYLLFLPIQRVGDGHTDRDRSGRDGRRGNKPRSCLEAACLAGC